MNKNLQPLLKVEILASLQKPKKICLKGSDGKSYTMMCKPKDDLRKDCRLMEFNCLINKVHTHLVFCCVWGQGYYVAEVAMVEIRDALIEIFGANTDLESFTCRYQFSTVLQLLFRYLFEATVIRDDRRNHLLIANLSSLALRCVCSVW